MVSLLRERDHMDDETKGGRGRAVVGNEGGLS